MRRFLKSIDLIDIKDQLVSIKDQVQDLRFQKPWAKARSASPVLSPVLYVGVAAGLAALGYILFRKRAEVARLCNNCGADLKGKWNELGLAEKPGEILEKMRGSVREPAPKFNGQGPV